MKRQLPLSYIITIKCKLPKNGRTTNIYQLSNIGRTSNKWKKGNLRNKTIIGNKWKLVEYGNW